MCEEESTQNIDFQQVFENSLNATFLCNQDQKIIAANRLFRKLSGYKLSELIGSSPILILDQDELNLNPIQFERLKDGETIHNERPIKISTGEIRTFELKAKIIFGDIIQVVANDITEKKRLIEKNEQQRILNNALINLLPGLFYVFDENMSLIKWNNETEHFFNLSINDIGNKSILDFFPDFEKQKIQNSIIPLTINRHNSTEAYLGKESGEMVSFLFNAVALQVGAQTLFGGIGQDISLIKQIQQQLIEEKQFSEMLLESLPGIFYVFDEQGNLVQWNKNAEYVTGYSADELQHKKFADFVVEEEQTNPFERYQNAIKKGNFQGYIRTIQNRKIPFLQSGIVFERNGQKYLMGIGFDISNQIHIRTQFQKSEEKFRNIFNSTSDAIIILDQDFKIITANQAFLTLNITTEERLKKLNLFDYMCENNKRDKIKRGTEIVKQGLVYKDEFLVCDSLHRIFPIEIRGRMIHYEGKECMLASLNDISERKRLEKEIYSCSLKAEESERERIAKELHDGLGPIFSACTIYLHNIKSVAYDEDEKRSYDKLCQLITESLIEIRSISNNLCPHVLHNFGLIHALKSLTENLPDGSKRKFNFECNVIQRLDEIVEITFYRIVTELMHNCIKHAQAQQIKISLLLKNNELTLLYEDDGIGFNFEETMKNNAGSGLFNIHSRVRSLGGDIVYSSAPDQGTHVKIELKLNS